MRGRVPAALVVTVALALGVAAVPPRAESGCPANSAPAYREDHTTYCRCVEGFAHVGDHCEPVATAAPPAAPLLSDAEEHDLGLKLAAQLDAKMTFFTDATVTAYLQDLVDRLARHSGRAGVTYRVRVCDDCALAVCGAACSLPGGVIYIHRAFIRRYVRSEAELAGVLAHEIGHIAGRHKTQVLEDHARAVGLGVLLAGPLWPLAEKAVYMKFQRDKEMDADRRAVEMLYRTGLKPSGLITVMDRWRRARTAPGVGAAVYEAYFGSHPSDAERIRALEPLLADPRFNAIPPGSSAQYHAVQRRLATP